MAEKKGLAKGLDSLITDKVAKPAPVIIRSTPALHAASTYFSQCLVAYIILTPTIPPNVKPFDFDWNDFDPSIVIATLLINPRFSNEEYTKYSFPSKNMEYMASGTPILTTKLPGMPKEYYEYIYLFEEESIEGMKNKMSMKAIEKISKTAINKNDIKWNFTKFLVDREGNVVGRYSPTYKPKDIESKIQELI